jgi:hypothetical protein
LRTIPGRRHASRFAFAAVGVAYALLQLLTTSVRRAPSWDESIYLSQVWRSGVALAFAPSRARGITLLVAPAAWTTGSVTLSRIFMAVAVAALLALAFSLWGPLVGRGAAVAAAALFAGWWVTIFYGSAVMPNLWSALLGVTAAGLTLRSLQRRRDRGWALTAGLGMALVRPPDAVLLLLVLVACAVWSRPMRRAVAWPATGIAVGAVVWLVEMSVRFSGPVEAVRNALTVGHVSAMSLPQRLLQQLAVSDGPTLGPVPHPSVPVLGTLWWAALLGAAILGVRTVRGTGARLPLRLAAASGAAMLAVYVVLISGIAPRFLLPGVAFLCLPAGYGMAGLLREHSRTVRIVAGGVLAALLVWNVATAARISGDALAAEALSRATGLAIRAAAAGRPCAVASRDSYPEVGFAAGCAAAPAKEGADLARQFRAWTAAGDAAFLVAPSDTPVDVEGMTVTPVDSGVPPGWQVVRVSPVP